MRRDGIIRRKIPTNLILGLVLVSSIIAVALFSNILAPYEYDETNLKQMLSAPNKSNLLGTDEYGRDVLSRTIHGTRITLRVALIIVIIQIIIGTTAGMLAGYFGGWTDRIISFATDFTWSIPALILAFAIIMLLGKGITNSVIAIAIVSWPQYSRIVRAKTQSIKNMPFIETGIAFGESQFSILIKYILPNVLPAVIVLASVSVPTAIISATSLSFLGLGAQSPSPDWGLTLSSSMAYINKAPWISIFPGLALVYTTLGFSLLGEGLRDLLDPRMKV